MGVVAAVGLLGCDQEPARDGDGATAPYRCDGPGPVVPRTCGRDGWVRTLDETDDLQRALKLACPGDTLHLGKREWVGDVHIPPGVSLEWGRIVGDVRACLAPAAPVTRLHHMNVVGSFYAEDGSVEFLDVFVIARGRIGLHLVEVDSVWNGNQNAVLAVATDGAADDWFPPADADADAVEAGPWLRTGALLEGGTAQGPLFVEVFGTFGYGIVLRGVEAERRSLSVVSFAGVGVYVEGGRLTAQRAYLQSRGLNFEAVEPSSYGLVAVGDAQVEMTDLDLNIREGTGVLQVGASVVLRDVTITAGGPAIWAQGAVDPSRTTLVLEDSHLLAPNGPAPLVLQSAGDVRLDNVRLEGGSCPDFFEWHPEGADGLQLVAPTGHLDLRRVGFESYCRAGLLIDGGDGTSPTFAFDAVTFSPGSLEALGVHVQGIDGVGLDGIVRSVEMEQRDQAAQAEGRKLEVALQHALPTTDGLP